MPKNIELKVRCSADALTETRGQLERLATAPLAVLHQIDHYYAVPLGRLKLRWIDGNDAELIRYHRPDLPGERVSAYELIPLPADAADGLDRVLTETLGQIASVDKLRTVGIVGRTRVHLDTVAGLGSFIELETVLANGEENERDGRTEYGNMVKLLGLDAIEPIAGSYCDLLLEGAHHP